MQPTSTVYRAWKHDSVFPSTDDPFFLDHVSRYHYAEKFISPETTVLDVACGKGYGSAILSRQARSTLGIDLNPDSLAFAQAHFGCPSGLSFQAWDALAVDQLGQRFDLVVAYEVIEHLAPADTDRFLASLKRALSPGGKLLISTPNHEVVLKAGVEVPDFHINNLTSAEFKTALKRHFPRVELFGQYRQRGAWRDLCFHLDYLSLRHRIGFLKKALSARPPAPGLNPSSTMMSPPAVWRPEQIVAESARYRFSKLVRKQAGLSFAVCSG